MLQTRRIPNHGTGISHPALRLNSFAVHPCYLLHFEIAGAHHDLYACIRKSLERGLYKPLTELLSRLLSQHYIIQMLSAQDGLSVVASIHTNYVFITFRITFSITKNPCFLYKSARLTFSLPQPLVCTSPSPTWSLTFSPYYRHLAAPAFRICHTALFLAI